MTWLAYDEALVDEIATAMDLREPNEQALRAVAQQIEDGDGREVICDLATGVGKTYLAAGLIDYLARLGVRNVLFVTPGTTIYAKTILNFTPGSAKYVPGAEFEPLLVTAENFARGQVGDALHDPSQLKVFVFNVQQLISPTQNTSRRTRADDEFIGGALYDHLRSAGDLVIIADEHHVYTSKAKAFHAAINDLNPRALVGLTTTPDPSDRDKVIYQYPLAHAIADRLVKVPVIVYRQDGLKTRDVQLADAAHLRELKEPTWLAYADAVGRERIHPVLFVVCQTIDEAGTAAETLAEHLPGDGQVLLITSQSTDDALSALANVELPDSPVRAIVSVDKLKEGWDVRNIAVIVGLRALASETLTEQILGRGLRLPFGARTGHDAIDHVDLVAHESYKELLRNKDSLLEKIAATEPDVEFTQSPDGVLRIARPTMTEGVAPGTKDVLAGLSDSDILIATSIEATEASLTSERASVGMMLPAVQGRPHIVFPRSDRVLKPVPFSLEKVSRSDARAEGAKYRHNQTVTIQGEAIDAERDLAGEVHVSTHAIVGVEATQNYLAASAVHTDLVRRVMSLNLVPMQLTERLHAEDLVDAFLEGAGVTPGSEENWTTRRATQAQAALGTLVRVAFERTDRQPSWEWKPQTLLQPKPQPAEILNWYDPFLVRAWYGGWTRSAEAAASFDSNTGEFAFATLADKSDGVSWWLRLYQTDPVWITYDQTRRYYPDFIVITTSGTQWLVEVKGDGQVTETTVLAKQAAAEDWAARATDSTHFGVWRYLPVSESEIKHAPNWESLVAR